jgi:hypothetical protein
MASNECSKAFHLTIVMEYCSVVNVIFIMEGALVILSWSDAHIQSRWCGDVGNIIQMAASVVSSLAWVCCLEQGRREQETCSKEICTGSVPRRDTW